LIIATALIGAVVLPAHTATAATQANNQCLITVNGTDANGNFIVESTKCYSSYAQVLTAAGGVNVPTNVKAGMAPTSFGVLSIIGTHYDGTSGSGSSFSVTGADCNGGGLPTPSGWNDRISSTWNGCPAIVHYENSDYTGSTFTTFDVGSVSNITGYMNNKTSAIKYFS